MTDDFTPLTQSGHWLDWLGDDPAQAVRGEIESALRQQVPTATLDWVRLTGSPEFLTGGRKRRDAPDMTLVTRAALAVPFELQVRSADRQDYLRGVFSWVTTGLDAERKDRTYLDLDVEMAWASEMLTVRIYERDAPAEHPEEPPPNQRSWWKFWHQK
ncbi:MAG: hypothetical protein JO316_25545 [Abitibacteriaceae bacterium]|nr:hypothetical protein [Abditibacteriaceae bacterium]MBV9868736.1 hypothetical protein [Abditibacteriaceae bacterium]